MRWSWRVGGADDPPPPGVDRASGIAGAIGAGAGWLGGLTTGVVMGVGAGTLGATTAGAVIGGPVGALAGGAIGYFGVKAYEKLAKH
jgi:hypothetical protein